MKRSDSFRLYLCLSIIPVFGLSACVSTSEAQKDISLALRTNPEILLEIEDDAVNAFHSLCLSGNTLPEDIYSFAMLEGWQDASDKQLSENALSRLRKTVLVIPGGGGRFDEEQKILFQSFTGKNYIANLERQFNGAKTQATKCEIYAKVPFLKSCESVRKMLGKAPDYNQVYKANDAHFIRWKTQIDGMESTISCNHTPQSVTLPYDGVSISVKVDYLSPARPKITRQLASDTSGR